MAHGDYNPLLWNDNLGLPHGSYWQSHDYQPLVDWRIRWAIPTYPPITSATIKVCSICGYWKSTDGTVECHCGEPPTPLTSDDLVWAADD